MIRISSIIAVILSFLTVAAIIYSGPMAVGAEESQSDQKEDIVVSHLLDGKKFIGPTGEKGKKIHHEDVLVFNNGLFTSSECFQFGFTGRPYSTVVEGDTIHNTCPAVIFGREGIRLKNNSKSRRFGQSQDPNRRMSKQCFYLTCYVCLLYELFVGYRPFFSSDRKHVFISRRKTVVSSRFALFQP